MLTCVVAVCIMQSITPHFPMTILSAITAKVNAMQDIPTILRYLRWTLEEPCMLCAPDRGKVEVMIRELEAKQRQQQEMYPACDLKKTCGCPTMKDGRFNRDCCGFGTPFALRALAAESCRGPVAEDLTTHIS